MRKKDINKKAEDILTNDLLVNKIKTEKQQAGGDYILATDIYHTINDQRKEFDFKQREIIRQRIFNSIRHYQKKRILLQISTAAVSLLLIGISSLYTFYSEPQPKIFAENNQIIPNSGSTKLILSGEEEVHINSDESEIEYTGNGNTIEIDATEKVTQNIDSKDLVMNTVIVPYGKRTKITLSDDSEIWLNSGSKLIFPARFAKEKREVYLEGEAIFEVSHDASHPFYVVTHNLDVKVLGTVFNVSAYSDDSTTNTILVSGSVELHYNDNSFFGKSKEMMVPNMLAVFNSSTGVVNQTKVKTELYTSWRDGCLIFERHPLGEIIKKISRYYNVSIKLSDQSLATEIFSGKLDLRNSADQVLGIIAEIISAKVENSDNQILITRI